jgi:hypothetical protein
MTFGQKPTIPTGSLIGPTSYLIMMIVFTSKIPFRRFVELMNLKNDGTTYKTSNRVKHEISKNSSTGDDIFLEWEMTISYNKYPSSIMYGFSRLTINGDGKIIEQRDYYDLWGDIFDNIPYFAKRYRKFMKKKFG